ncbi:MAG: ribokinase [Clostridia bacterium]|nr:ribokinase [Clostridia bacterium]
MKILNFGSLNIDLFYHVERFASAGETINSTTYQKNIGGKGLNQSVALARAGAQVYHAGNVGQDGQFLVDFLQTVGVNTDLISTAPLPSGNAVIQIDTRGENCILLYGGANHCVTEEQIDHVLAHFEAGDMVVLQNEINQMSEIITHAHQKGMTVVLNPSPFAGCAHLPLQLVDYFIVNQHEAAQLAEQNEQEAMISTLLQRFPRAKFVMTLGGDGSLYFDSATRHFQKPYPTNVVDTTGAGDTFTGFFFAALSQGKPIPYAMELAAKAASVTISQQGAAPSIPTLDTVLSL